jgi:hypothetical protein
VHLVGPVPLHVEQASQASREAAAPLASITVGDSRELHAAADSRDHLLSLPRAIEAEPSLIGMSQNFLAIAQASAQS